MADIVPDDIVGIRRKSGGDVVRVLRREVPIDEIHDPLLVVACGGAGSLGTRA
jgi:hypothetical protein